jgi:hypothetical protein
VWEVFFHLGQFHLFLLLLILNIDQGFYYFRMVQGLERLLLLLVIEVMISPKSAQFDLRAR